jgi:MSHA biogenesis protein MshO
MMDRPYLSSSAGSADPAQRRQKGFTLIELVLVITLMGVVGLVVAVTMKTPVDTYLAGSRRADLSDAADTALRRVNRDLRKALPNSVRLVADDTQCLEFIPTRTGGRYREALDSRAALAQTSLNVLDFNQVESSFNMLGENPALPADQHIRAGDLVAVYNLGSAGSNAYQLDNIAQISANTLAIPGGLLSGVSYGAETQLQLSGRSTPFPLPSANKRFQIIPADEQVVSYVCSGAGLDAAGNGQGTLYRYARSALSNPQGLTAYPPPASCAAILSNLHLATDKPAVLASNVSACRFDYDSASGHLGLVSLALSLTRSNETVRLSTQAGVENLP